MSNTEQLKLEVIGHLEAAIADNGGLERMRKIYGLMTGVVDFLAGWACARVLLARRAANLLDRQAAELRGHSMPESPTISHEEIRRIYDLVRLSLDTGSSTS